MAAPNTGVGELTNLIQTAYDRKIRLALRSIPTFRQVATVKAAQQTAPGATITFGFHSDLAVATTPLDASAPANNFGSGSGGDYTDPTGVVLNNPSQVSVKLHEYGNWTVITKGLQKFSIDSALDSNVSNILAYNQANSIDTLIEQTWLKAGTQVVKEAAGSLSTTANTNTIVATDTLKSRDFRYVVAKFRAASAVPVDGQNYVAYVHPEVAVDFRSETGSGGWRYPHEEGGAGDRGILAGEIGTYESVRFVETPRCSSATTGSSSARVFQTYVFAQEALAEAVAEEFHTVINGTIADPLDRRTALGWYGIAGWNLFRAAALWRIETGSSVNPA